MREGQAISKSCYTCKNYEKAFESMRKTYEKVSGKAYACKDPHSRYFNHYVNQDNCCEYYHDLWDEGMD